MRKNILILVAVIFLSLVGLGASWLIYLNKAHSSFSEYYKFRGCLKLIEKTENFGTCEIGGGKLIKIVKISDKWYLDGDGPGVW